MSRLARLVVDVVKVVVDCNVVEVLVDVDTELVVVNVVVFAIVSLTVVVVEPKHRVLGQEQPLTLQVADKKKPPVVLHSGSQGQTLLVHTP
mmetsp:Transcript_109285/g.189641  ORF Transcript_109285/g.189641 Transcript_109285/m.189641 type:complete len:91 (+) Transcript_109285:1991-2263(+)